ncbi:hypothetical protein PSH58_05490 [Pseudomonas hefeiensis]|uniref:CBM-cenC domain-containing protein n=1 Tax=Pseudomonas hefeiensis TaxID=2738125 RepID=A0ABY9GDZ1_9PSED|nr:MULTISPECIES: hypothetical protein [unclassified Pseudomonas]WLH13807.1 hypothetical protein PSH57_05495 [Pseudomonas sp. FP205]WLH96860.1 hypothetical protein PSH58_05490 [Pseudomonas sp. FP53]WLI41137.1 hypothetical protein PSH74_05490 [Pseudomonas sp. FP821]
MSDSSKTADSTILLYPPRLPGATEPVQGAKYGVPIHLYNPLPFGCEVLVEAYLGQQPNDTVSINLNGEEALASKQTQGVNDDVTLYIPHGKLLPGMVNRLTFTVTRPSANPETSYPPLEILYNSIRPGNQDRSPGEPGHSELVLLLPDEIKNGVGPGFVSATVCVEYPYCRAYDEIRLNCNGRDVFHKVDATQAPAPPNHGSATPTRICFDVTSADLVDDPQFMFSFTVRDQLFNSPDLDNVWSAVQIVDVDKAGQRLPAPIPREVLSEAGDDPSLIELEKLGPNPLSLIILTSDPRFMPGDVIEATYTAKVMGQPEIVVPVTGIVEVDELGQKKACVLQIPNDKVFPDSTVHVSYRLLRGTTPVGSSRTAIATVVGAALALPPPRIMEARDGVLNPINAAGTLTALVPHYQGMLSTDKVSVIWAGHGTPEGGSHTTTPVEVGTVGEKPIDLPTELVAYCLGKPVTVIYTVTRDVTWPPSPPLTLTVLELPDAQLPKPLIVDAANGGEGTEFNIDSFASGSRVTVEPWPLIAAGQCVWLHAEGTDLNGLDFNIDLYTAKPLSAGEVTAGLSVPLPRTQINRLRNGSDLKLILHVTFNRSVDKSQAIAFPIRTYLVTPLPLDDVSRFENTNWNGWRAGPAAQDSRDWKFGQDESGRTLLGNGTYTDSSAGIVLWKGYTGLRIGARYEFSLDARRHANTSDAVPSLSLATKTHGRISTVVTLATTTWQVLRGEFYSTARDIELHVNSHQASGVGNDYYVTDIRLRML